MRGRRLVVSSLATMAYLASVSVAAPASNPSARQGFWIGFGVGSVGYDLRVWTKASVTLGANFWYGQRFGSTGFGDPVTTTWKQNVVDVTLGITFH